LIVTAIGDFFDEKNVAAAALVFLFIFSLFFSSVAGDSLFVDADGYLEMGMKEPLQKLHVEDGSIAILCRNDCTDD
jgi:hypothetical protein